MLESFRKLCTTSLWLKPQQSNIASQAAFDACLRTNEPLSPIAFHHVNEEQKRLQDNIRAIGVGIDEAKSILDHI